MRVAKWSFKTQTGKTDALHRGFGWNQVRITVKGRRPERLSKCLMSSCMTNTWVHFSEKLTFVTLSTGLVGKFGEVKVKPLSVPASKGWRSKVTSSFHWSPWHKLTLSTPTNQSGLGITFTTRDNCGSEREGMQNRTCVVSICTC